MEEKKEIGQPGIEFQRVLDAVMSEEPTEIEFCGRKVRLGWMRYGARRKFTRICLKEKNAYKRDVKLCATVLLGSKWRLLFFYWIYWRWLYYVVEVDDVEMLRVIDVCKKKIPSTICSLLTILATGMTDVMMSMTRVETDAIQAALRGGKPSA